MENGIKALIEKERDAKEQVEKAILYKEEMKKKSNVDALVAISMVIEDQKQVISQKLNESQEHLNKFSQEKDKEYEKIKQLLEKKDTNSLIEKLARIITGESENPL